MRINRFLARSGKGSRRKVEELIKSGFVCVNGEIVTDLATEVDPKKDQVTLNGAMLNLPQNRYLMLNKPRGYVVTKSDPHAKKTVFELLPPSEDLFPVGRLDKDTEGLLLVTNDGDFAEKITHPRVKVEKEYIVKTAVKVEKADAEKLEKGVALDDGQTAPAKVKIVDPRLLHLTITEGRNRQVRRMLEAVGNKVISLKRIRINGFHLDVPLGEYRELTKEELEKYA